MLSSILNYFKFNPNGNTGYKVFKVIWTIIFTIPYFVMSILYLIIKGFSSFVDFTNLIITGIPVLRLLWIIVVTVIYLVETVLYLVMTLGLFVCVVPDFFAPKEDRPRYIFEDEKVMEEE